MGDSKLLLGRFAMVGKAQVLGSVGNCDEASQYFIKSPLFLIGRIQYLDALVTLVFVAHAI